MIWGLSDAMAMNAVSWAGGAVLPGLEALFGAVASGSYDRFTHFVDT
jgi:hypothetical protein